MFYLDSKIGDNSWTVTAVAQNFKQKSRGTFTHYLSKYNIANNQTLQNESQFQNHRFLNIFFLFFLYGSVKKDKWQTETSFFYHNHLVSYHFVYC